MMALLARGILGTVAALALSASACGASSVAPADAASDARPTTVLEGDYVWRLPAGFPKPRVPGDNPMSVAKVELGRHLFHDKRLSANLTQSCASCHQQERAFADERARALGSTGEMHPRGSMGLANVGYASSLTWANDLVSQLERQALLPMFGETPVELGLAGKEDELLARLRAEPRYQSLFPQAYPERADPFAIETVTKALAAFQRTLISGDSPFDRFTHGIDPRALSEAARRGRDLFFSERLECFHCHGGFAFTDSVTFDGKVFDELSFHNTGLYNIDGKGGYSPPNTGLMAISGKPRDMGRFKAPSLRNIAVTAPYMHDGSVATLDEALDHYAAGGRTITSGALAGVGSASPLKSEFINGFRLSAGERADVLRFLESLTDQAFLKDPRFSDPWGAAGSSPAP